MPKCPTCGDELDVIDISTVAGPYASLVDPCRRPECQPPPTPEQLRREADDRWLAYHRALASGHIL